MNALAASTSAFDEPGTLGFLVVAGMGIILVFLFRSMAKHLRKVSGTGKAGLPGPAGAAGGGPGQAQAVAPADEADVGVPGSGFDAGSTRDSGGDSASAF